MDAILKLWGKKTDQSLYHPLLFHMIDVGAVIYRLVSDIVPDAVFEFLSKPFKKEVTRESLSRWYAFLGALHDIGKASPVFQGRDKIITEELKSAGFPFNLPAGASTIYHGNISSWYLFHYFKQKWKWEPREARAMAIALGGHHGFWFSDEEMKKRSREKGVYESSGKKEKEIDEGKWNEVRLTCIAELKKGFDLGEVPPLEWDEHFQGFCTYFAGIVSFADWIGSDERYFPFRSGIEEVNSYFQIARCNAERALHETGFTGWAPKDFCNPRELFGPRFSPRVAQELIIRQKESLPGEPTITLIEAPTGEGKTEGAWILADHLVTKKQKKGVYFAMPTQATSNQMFDRVAEFIKRRYPGASARPYLLHGNALFSGKMPKSGALGGNNEDEEFSSLVAQWFLPKKRTLLAPFGVGTIDQALLAVLLTRHFFVRLYGLANKVIIFDEIHAYDTYMDTLLRRLLTWLRELDCDVILLSATLPAKKRQELIEAFTGKRWKRSPRYPSVVFATPSGEKVFDNINTGTGKSVQLDIRPRSGVTEIINEYKKNGGCYAVICNTVNSAQAMYQALSEGGIEEDDLILFHARFPYFRRDQIEKRVIRMFGKDSDCRPKRAIVVATQIIEQSLDICFDRLYSELAPIDLLLQRMGRLWRHLRENRPFDCPRLTILLNLKGGKPDDSDYSKVYFPYILLRTYLVIKERDQLTVPGDVQPLIEEVYGSEDRNAFGEEWEKELGALKNDLEEERLEQERAALTSLVLPPGDESLFHQTRNILKEEAPEYHQALRAATRLIRPSVDLICFMKVGNSLMTMEGDLEIDFNRELQPGEIEKLLRNKITLSRRSILTHFMEQPVPENWKKVGPLRYCRPLIFIDGEYRVNEKSTITYDSEIGIQYGSI